MNSLQSAAAHSLKGISEPIRSEPDSSLLISRVRALFPTREVLMEHVKHWEKRAPWSLLNDQLETVRIYGFTKDSIAIVLNDDVEKGKFADIVIVLSHDKNVRFRYYFTSSILEPHYHRLY